MSQDGKVCQDCKHYSKPSYGLTMGQCEYPIPAWLKSGTGGGFVNGYEAQQCVLYDVESASSLGSEETSALKST